MSERSAEELDAYEQQMLEYAQRQAKALETLQSYAFWWTLLAVAAAVVAVVVVLGAR